MLRNTELHKISCYKRLQAHGYWLEFMIHIWPKHKARSGLFREEGIKRFFNFIIKR